MRSSHRLSLSLHRLKGVSESPEARLLEDGVRKMSSHLVNHRFNLDDAKTAAGKAALLTKLIAREDENPSLSYWRTMPYFDALRTLTITGEWERLNRLKATNPETFWYWYQASRIISHWENEVIEFRNVGNSYTTSDTGKP
jgi:hypothetical protein